MPSILIDAIICSGHLFQNRYKSILCQEDAYLLELVRYIHLNPLRAKIVGNYQELQAYPFCGHSAIMGMIDLEWQEINSMLALFDKRLSLARSRYLRYVEEGITMGRRKDLIGGGLIRSQGGWTAVKKQRRAKECQKGDERILGDSDFVEEVLKQSAETLERRYQLQSKGYNTDKVVKRIAYLLQISPEEVLAAGKKRKTVAARSLFCLWMSNELGIIQVQLANQLNLSQAAVSLTVARGRTLAKEQSYTLVD